MTVPGSSIVRDPIPARTRFFATSFARARMVITRMWALRILWPVRLTQNRKGGEEGYTVPGPPCPTGGSDGRIELPHLQHPGRSAPECGGNGTKLGIKPGEIV